METTQTLKNVLADIEAEGFGNDPRVKKLVERAFRAGLTRNLSIDPLEGYSNLTAAISAGEPGRAESAVREPRCGDATGEIGAGL